MSYPRVPATPAAAASRPAAPAAAAGIVPPPPAALLPAMLPLVPLAEGVALAEGASSRGNRVAQWLMAFGGPCTCAASSTSAPRDSGGTAAVRSQGQAGGSTHVTVFAAACIQAGGLAEGLLELHHSRHHIGTPCHACQQHCCLHGGEQAAAALHPSCHPICPRAPHPSCTAACAGPPPPGSPPTLNTLPRRDTSWLAVPYCTALGVLPPTTTAAPLYTPSCQHPAPT